MTRRMVIVWEVFDDYAEEARLGAVLGPAGWGDARIIRDVQRRWERWRESNEDGCDSDFVTKALVQAGYKEVDTPLMVELPG